MRCVVVGATGLEPIKIFTASGPLINDIRPSGPTLIPADKRASLIASPAILESLFVVFKFTYTPLSDPVGYDRKDQYTAGIG